jgi:hypothetical protein
MNTRRRQFIGWMLLSVYLTSCSSWHVQPVSPEQVVSEDQPSEVRVTLVDSSQFVMKEPRVSGDTLSGLVSGGQQDILLSDISRMEVKRGNVLKTLGFVVGVAGALVIICVAACDFAIQDPFRT